MVKKSKINQPEHVTADVMLHATTKANQNKAMAFWGANLGDSIERRFNGGGGYGDYNGLGGADGGIWQGGGGSWNAMGWGAYSGPGLAYGLTGRGWPYSGGMYGSYGFRYLRKFSASASFIHQIIASCILCYLNEGVVRRVLDLYADIACSKFTIQHPDKSVRNFYETWSKKTKIDERLRTFFLTIFTTGNLFIYRHWAKLSNQDKTALKTMSMKLLGDHLYVEDEDQDVEITPEIQNSWVGEFLDAKKAIPFTESNNTKQAKAATPPNKKSVLNRELPQKDGMIPWGYTALNPLQMELRGKKFQGENYWIMALDRNDTKDILQQYGINSSSQDIGTTQVNLPKELKGKMTSYKGGGAGYISEVKFDNTELTAVQDYKFDWFDWSVPFVYPAMMPLTFKQCLRKMEMRACESVINSIFLFKLGDIKNGLPAEEAHFERLADMLQMPGQVQNIIWNEAIDAKVIQPNIAEIFDAKKHESADKDILMALGVPEVMLGSNVSRGGSFTNAYVSLVSVLKRLETTRNLIEQWLSTELEIIAKVMNFRRMPQLKWDRSVLSDENAVRNLYISLFDRGIVSRETVLREFDTDFDTELARQVEEKAEIPKGKNNDIMEPKGPFITPDPKLPPTPPGGFPKPGGPPGGGLPQKGTPPAQPKTANGRPPNSKEPVGRGPQQNKRGPKGQSLAMLTEFEDLLTLGTEMLHSLEERIEGRMLKARGVKYAKELQQNDRERLENIVYNVFSNMPSNKPNNFDTDDFLVHALQSNATAKIKANVLALYAAKVARYEDKFKKPPSREHRRQMIVSAWSQAAMNERTYLNMFVDS